MTVQNLVEAESTPPIIIQATRGLSALDLRAVWHYRELLFFLVWRDVKVRYKQTALGVLWILLQPVLSTVVFTLLFGILLNVPSDARLMRSLPWPGCCPGITSPALSPVLLRVWWAAPT